MGAWAMFAAPLLMGNDVRNLTAAQQAILLNRDVIAINQDPAGVLPPLLVHALYTPTCPFSMLRSVLKEAHVRLQPSIDDDPITLLPALLHNLACMCLTFIHGKCVQNYIT